MENMICKKCGGPLIFNIDEAGFVCKFCGTKHFQNAVQHKPQIVTADTSKDSKASEKEDDFDFANTLSHTENREEANAFYKKLCKKHPNDFRSWWGVIETSKSISEYPSEWITSNGSWGYDALKSELLLQNEYKMAIFLAPSEIKYKIIKNQEKRNNEFDFVVLQSRLQNIDNNILLNNNARKLATERKETAQSKIAKVSTIKAIGWISIAIGVVTFFTSANFNVLGSAWFGILVIIIGVVALCNTNETYILSKYTNDSKIDLSSFDSKNDELTKERLVIAEKIENLKKNNKYFEVTL